MLVSAEKYYEIHENVINHFPNIKGMIDITTHKKELVVEKGRKKEVKIKNLKDNSYEKIERILDTEEYKSFMEISLRAAKCPLPMNLDVWDGLYCPFKCKYCYADYFRASLYTSFFDNAKEIRFRHVNPDLAIEKMESCIKGKSVADVSPEVKVAIKRRIPQRFGIRFEDFIPKEKLHGISLKIMKYMDDIEYPYMINTKSTLCAEPEYSRYLGDMTAIHITLITLNNKLAKRIEPGAPTPAERLKAIETLSEITTVVPRIEPFMVGINSDPTELEEYAALLKDMGIKNTTWDTYSYSANSSAIASNFSSSGYNWDWMFEMTSEFQPLGSLLMEGAMNIFRKHGIKCSTFDFGCLSGNDHEVCCAADGIKGFENFNRHNILSAARLIVNNPDRSWRYKDFVKWAGPPLSKEIGELVKRLWIGEENAWDIDYVAGVNRIGIDSDGMPIYRYDKDSDYRIRVFNSLEKMGY